MVFGSPTNCRRRRAEEGFVERAGRLWQVTALVLSLASACIDGFAIADDEPDLVRQVFDARALAASEGERESLAECVIGTVASSTWSDVGGPGTYEWRRGKLAVSNTADACHRVSKLLDVLGRVPAVGDRDAIKAPKTPRLDVAAFHDGEEDIEIVVYPVLDILAAGGRIDPSVRSVERAELVTEALIEAVTTIVAPTTWDAVGGKGSIHEYGPRGALVVSQSKAVHPRIESLLAGLRKAPTAAETFKQIRGTRAIDVGTDDSNDAKQRIAIYPVADLVLRDETDAEGDFESLIEVVTTSIIPETWDAVGGSGTVKEFATHNVLVISQTKEAHDVIEKLLAALRSIPVYSEATARAEPQSPVVVGTHKCGDAEMQVVVYDVGRRILARDGSADFEGLIAAIYTADEAAWDAHGGPGTCCEFVHRGAVVVVNTKDVQEKVRRAIDGFQATNE